MKKKPMIPSDRRLFASLIPPPDWIRGARHISAHLQALYGSAVRWSEPDSYHITVRFFGNIEHDSADALISTWTTLGDDRLAAPTFFPEPCGCFPAEDPERVVWVGARASSEWETILTRIDRLAASLGIDYRRDTSIPHLTLGRVRQPDRVVNLRDDATHLLLAAKPFVASEIELTLSTPSPAGSTYTRCAAFSLKKHLSEVE